MTDYRITLTDGTVVEAPTGEKCFRMYHLIKHGPTDENGIDDL